MSKTYDIQVRVMFVSDTRILVFKLVLYVLYITTGSCVMTSSLWREIEIFEIFEIFDVCSVFEAC